jgi:hypothetical protein
MLVLDALFDHIQQISSHIEIIRSLVQRSPISASDVRAGSCVTSNAGPHGDAELYEEMKEGPSRSAIRC